MKLLIFAFLGAFLHAETYTLRNNSTGSVFTCSSGGGGAGPADPACITQMNDYCDFKTNYSDEICFSKSAQACANQVSMDCVRTVWDQCDFQTNYTNERCLDESIAACGGNASAMGNLIQATREKALQDARLVTR